MLSFEWFYMKQSHHISVKPCCESSITPFILVYYDLNDYSLTTKILKLVKITVVQGEYWIPVEVTGQVYPALALLNKGGSFIELF